MSVSIKSSPKVCRGYFSFWFLVGGLFHVAVEEKQNQIDQPKCTLSMCFYSKYLMNEWTTCVKARYSTATLKHGLVLFWIHSRLGHVHGGFLKWWYPTTMGFPTRNDHFGVFWGYHHLRKHPCTWWFNSWPFFLVVSSRDLWRCFSWPPTIGDQVGSRLESFGIWGF